MHIPIIVENPGWISVMNSADPHGGMMCRILHVPKAGNTLILGTGMVRRIMPGQSPVANIRAPAHHRPGRGIRGTGDLLKALGNGLAQRTTVIPERDVKVTDPGQSIPITVEAGNQTATLTARLNAGMTASGVSDSVG